MLQDKLTGMISNTNSASTVDNVEKKPPVGRQDPDPRPSKKRKIEEEAPAKLSSQKKGSPSPSSCLHARSSSKQKGPNTSLTAPSAPSSSFLLHNNTITTKIQRPQPQYPQLALATPRISSAILSSSTTTNLFSMSSTGDLRPSLFDLETPPARMVASPFLSSAFPPICPTLHEEPPSIHGRWYHNAPTTRDHNKNTSKRKRGKNTDVGIPPSPNTIRNNRPTDNNCPERLGVHTSTTTISPSVEWEVAQVINDLAGEMMVPPVQSKMSIAALLN